MDARYDVGARDDTSAWDDYVEWSGLDERRLSGSHEGRLISGGADSCPGVLSQSRGRRV